MKPVPKDARRLPLTTFVSSPLGYRTRQAIQRAVTEARLNLVSQAIQDELSDRLLSLNEKHASPPFIVQRLENNWQGVRVKALKRDPSLDAYALDVSRTLMRELVVDTESFFASLKSLLDVATRLVGTIERRVLRIPQPQQTKHDRLVALGIDVATRETLVEIRDHLIHESAPWFEVVISKTEPPDLLIGYSTRPNYTTGAGFILLSELAELVQGVNQHLDAIEEMLVDCIDRFNVGGDHGAAS